MALLSATLGFVWQAIKKYLLKKKTNSKVFALLSDVHYKPNLWFWGCTIFQLATTDRPERETQSRSSRVAKHLGALFAGADANRVEEYTPGASAPVASTFVDVVASVRASGPQNANLDRVTLELPYVINEETVKDPQYLEMFRVRLLKCATKRA